MRHVLGCILIGSAVLTLSATGCTLKATINQTTDTTSNITGTTSGSAWWNEDGQIKPDFKTTAFVTLNQDNLQQDLAAGRGEYLASVSALLGVPEDQQSAFSSAASELYRHGRHESYNPTGAASGYLNAICSIAAFRGDAA